VGKRKSVFIKIRRTWFGGPGPGKRGKMKTPAFWRGLSDVF